MHVANYMYLRSIHRTLRYEYTISATWYRTERLELTKTEQNTMGKMLRKSKE